MRALRRAGAAIALALLLAGVPLGLLAFGHVERLWQTDWALALRRPDDGSLALAALAAIGWVAWAVFAASTILELATLTAPGRVRLPRLGVAQALAGVLIAAVLAGSPRPALADVPRPAPIVATVDETRAPGQTPAQGASPATAPQEVPAARTVVVVEGDTLIDIAERELGDGARWHEIYELNRERVSDPDQIAVGWVLRVPAKAAPTTPTPPAAPPRAAASGSLSSSTLPSAGQGGALTPPVRTTPPPTTDRAELIADEGVPMVAAGASTGGILAAGILLALARRRAAAGSRRPVGRRFLDASPAGQRLEQVLGATAAPEPRERLLAAQRALALAFREAGRLPRLDHARVGAQVRFVFADDPGTPPLGFVDDGAGWRFDGSPPAGDVVAYPALAGVGVSEGDTIYLDLADGLSGANTAVQTAIARDLLHAPWAPAARVVMVGDAPEGATGGTAAQVRELVLDELDRRGARREAPAEGAGHPRRALCTPRRAAAARPELVLVDVDPPPVPDPRLAWLDPDLADAHAPLVVLGTDVAGVGCVAPWVPDAAADLRDGILQTRSVRIGLTPFAVDDATASTLAELERAADGEHTGPAPWWDDTPLPANVVPLLPRLDAGPRPGCAGRPSRTVVSPPEFEHPTLRLLGPIDLMGATGERPPRAERACLEYCGWLLENPGATASQMADALIVAEGTRRSNMSRLRTWLGRDDDGSAYLPDAYSGRIRLHPAVSSDWIRFQLITGPGVNRLSPDSLASALELVRGAPLADAAPTQWHWAEPLRSDMVSVIRDVGHRLAELALAEGDVDLVRWATARALAAAPEDELLLGMRIRAEHRVGNRREVERLALRLAGHARHLGIDLQSETVELLQVVMEGRPRAQRIDA